MTAQLTVDVHDLRDLAVFDRADELASAHHEQVIHCRDAATGLKAIIAIHDTTLGPALGGTRFFPYKNEAAGLTDVLRLSRGMTYKAAAAGLPLGGGKAVILGDPNQIKTEGLLEAFGRFVDFLGGRYITAADVGTTERDLDVIHRSTSYVVGRSADNGGSGDSGFSTAFGVYSAMKAAAEHRWGATGLAGRSVGVEGAGKVGFHLIGLLLAAGAAVAVCDPDEDALGRVRRGYPEVSVLRSVLDANIDVYAPCALGGTLSQETVPTLLAGVVCGAANNQLLTHDVDSLLQERDVLWVPDYIANAGGLVQVNGERTGKTREEVDRDITALYTTVAEILEAAESNSTSTGVAADAVVQARLDRARAVQQGRL